MMINSYNDSTADFLGRSIGNYRLLRLLGQGAFASVYLGEHRYLKRLAAVKILRTVLGDQDKERFLEEAQLLANLSHPHIVYLHEFAVTQTVNYAGDGQFREYIPYFAMDFAPGGSLRALYPAGSCLFIDVAIGYLKQIAVALQYAHNNGVIHRDVKPENCLLNEQREVILSDFGLALFAPTPDLLSTQQMAGTLPYAAPEQLRGKPSFASDQYSLGVIAYEWLCGNRPFEGEEVELIMQHLSSPPPPLRSKNPAISQAVEEVVLKALEKNPQQRYPSVQAFVSALEHACYWRNSDISPYSHMAVRVSPLVPNPEVEPVYLGKAKRRQVEEEIYIPLAKQKQATRVRRIQEQPQRLLSLPPRQEQKQATRVRRIQGQPQRLLSLPPRQEKKKTSLIIGIVAFILLLSSGGAFSLKILTASSAVHLSEVRSPVTHTHVLALADFAVKSQSIRGMTLLADETFFAGDHADLGAGLQVVADFNLPGSPGPGKSMQVTISIKALVSRSGNNQGYAPIDLSINGHAVVQSFTFPGEGFQPNETSFQVPPGLLVYGKNELKLLASDHALTMFWLYSIEVIQDNPY